MAAKYYTEVFTLLPEEVFMALAEGLTPDYVEERGDVFELDEHNYLLCACIPGKSAPNHVHAFGHVKRIPLEVEAPDTSFVGRPAQDRN